jgi:hypothetical protein
MKTVKGLHIQMQMLECNKSSSSLVDKNPPKLKYGWVFTIFSWFKYKRRKSSSKRKSPLHILVSVVEYESSILLILLGALKWPQKCRTHSRVLSS